MSFSLIILGCYLLVVGTCIFVWNTKLRAKGDGRSKQAEHTPLSIIIPFRNEENHLENMLSSILINLKGAPHELILINDHSEDNSFEIAKQCTQSFPNTKLLSLIAGSTGKKAAIKFGITHATNDYILQTDADCVFEKNWLTTMSKEASKRILENPDKHSDFAILGPISIVSKGPFSFLNSIESIALQSINFAMASFQLPMTASGANLLYSKDLHLSYDKSKIGAEHASGDDHFLVKFAQESGIPVFAINSREALVTTSFPGDLRSIIAQRVRWAKKAGGEFGFTNILGVIMLLTNLLLLVNFGAIFFKDHRISGIIFIASKLLADYLLLQSGKRVFKFPNVAKFVLFELSYPLFQLTIVIATFLKSPSWKSRKV